MPLPLPHELYALILDHAAPFVHQHDPYDERQATLSACCLVSKLFLSLARPLLWQVVGCHHLRQVERYQAEAARGASGYTRYTRLLSTELLGDDFFADDDERVEVEVDDVADACRCFPQLRRLSVYAILSDERVDVSTVVQHVPSTSVDHLARSHPRLTFLYPADVERLLLNLFHQRPWHLSRPIRLASLRELALLVDFDPLDEESWRALLTPQALPSLRALVVQESSDEFLWPPLSVDLVRQVEALQLNAARAGPGDGRNIPASYTSASAVVLLQSHAQQPYSMNPQLANLFVSPGDAQQIANVTSIASSSPSLRTLFLADGIAHHDPSSRYSRDADARRACDALLAFCAQRNIEIRWCPEEDSDPEETEPYVLRQFLLFARERARGGLAQ